ncbi:RNA polymerase subunit sigma-70 [Pseudonocardia sp. CNS-139]|nr:RNA polymerase subunit sigma-70 [Pseudonocardia sp. CNS-139]
MDTTELARTVAAATAGDEAAFGSLCERHRRELHVHCYRMLGSFSDAEDVVQETFLRAWRALDTFDGSTLFRAWLYKIATNASLDLIRRERRRVRTVGTHTEVPWLEPYPDRLLDQASPEDEPDAAVVARETIELAFLATTQLLPARQRAVLILRDVVGWTAAETAAALDLSVAAANSALQRARATLRERLPQHREAWTAGETGEQERALLQRFIDANDAADPAVLAELFSEDIRVSMPPYPHVFEGLGAMRELFERAFRDGTHGDWRLVPTAANRMPAAASYHRAPGDTEFRAFKFDVLRVQGDRIAEITTFGPALFPAFGLPEVYPGR